MRVIVGLVVAFFCQILFGQEYQEKVTGYLKSKKHEKALEFISKKKAELTYQSDTRKKFNLIVELNILEGDIYFSKSDFQTAEKFYEEAVDALYQKVKQYPKKVSSYDLGALDKSANVNLILGDYLIAGKLLTKSDSLRQHFGNKKENRLSIHDYVFGKYYFLISDLENSKESFFQYINSVLTKQYTGRQIYRVASCYNYLSEIALIERKPWESLRFAKKSFHISEKRFATKSVENEFEELIKSYDIMSKSFLAIGKFKEAKARSDDALKLYIEQYSDTTIKFIDIWLSRAEIMWQTNKMEEAHKNFQIANKIQLNYISKTLPNLGEIAKENFYFKISQNMNLYYAFCADLLENTTDYLVKTKLLKEMLAVRLNTKGKILSESNRMIEYVQKSKDPEITQIYGLLKKRKEELSLKVGQGYSEIALNTLRTEINGYQETLAQLLKSEGVRFETKLTKVSDIPGKMSSNSLAIEVIRAPHYVSYKQLSNKQIKAYKKFDSLHLKPSLSFDAPKYIYIKLTDQSEIGSVVFKQGKTLETSSYKTYQNMIRYKVKDEKSYNAYYGPFELWAEDISTIYFSGDGVYNQINLSVLQNPRTDKFVVEEHEVYNVNNLDEISAETEVKLELTSAMLVGRPAYSFTNSFQSDSTIAYVGERGIEEFHSQGIADLPGTEEEINKIYDILSDDDGVVVDKFLKEKATERIIKDHKSASVLHISTHGFFVKNKEGENVNPMMRSGLLLAGVSDYEGDKDDDGILTAYEASNIDLKDTKLVVLSACETGLGEIKNGEGVYGLQRAFQIAGVKYVLMSMWKVDDEATAKLMTYFYKDLEQNRNVPLSFNRAQLKLKEEYKSVYYWGAFKLIGN